MIVPDAEIIPFVDQFVESSDWAIWPILSDFFAEREDDVGQAFCLWVFRDQKYPSCLLGDKKTGMTFWTGGQEYQPSKMSPFSIGERMMEVMREASPDVWYRGASTNNCYLALLHCYRRLASLSPEKLPG